ncbi:peptide chain release factor N(5)-glutamine methyltransferase [Periweissella beninensis]|uniref:Release factor glutamine methyltransferase n=1 Tax=Periweissella beninensis TaxID=504936 RepID=A0ABT0VFN4_9LACO|nr:peptide chain release factor N(5)-glutamine methyltransferase [Periweissella beninensis]MBM7543659.1 release factor glutamine methyltransferase [Periweissella beninensis]MCM2436638.1 peptide chain release factor N(5)-glutamine methyltransferase [Periweissella beninensis]MCT4395608.1 peptide chain release factor N(5)-glutamine methyltransferase [Periweissella beninensis]
MTKTNFEVRQWAFSYLNQADVDLLLMGLNDWTYSQLILHLRDECQNWPIFEAYVRRARNDEPIQYILKQAHFYDRFFYVDQRVLIPRMETEELIEWVLADNQQSHQKVLDLGTGSGAIAITLKCEQPSWQVTASDISKDAIAVAKQNSTSLKANVDFIVSDVFNNIDDKYDLIISNPPYIADTEITVMDQTVLKYEPHLALFAPNHGLAIYQQIALNLKDHLLTNGTAYFEIGYQQGPQIIAIFKKALPDATVSLQKDMAGNDRMIKVGV